jgi:adenylate cyclase
VTVAPKKVLVVDDTPLNVKMLADLLTFKGYQTATAASGAEALAKIEADRPDIVLLDVMMPGMNGIEAFKVLRADPQTSSIPIVAVTASAMTEDRQKIMAAGFEGLQTKPINVKEFLEAVAQTLKKSGGAA